MRDINRIDRHLDELKELWKKLPDWRFGQLVCNTLGMVQHKVGMDLFYVEDDKLFEAWREVINEMIPKGEGEE